MFGHIFFICFLIIIIHLSNKYINVISVCSLSVCTLRVRFNIINAEINTLPRSKDFRFNALIIHFIHYISRYLLINLLSFLFLNFVFIIFLSKYRWYEIGQDRVGQDMIKLFCWMQSRIQDMIGLICQLSRQQHCNLMQNATPTIFFMSRYTFISKKCLVFHDRCSIFFHWVLFFGSEFL